MIMKLMKYSTQITFSREQNHENFRERFLKLEGSI